MNGELDGAGVAAANGEAWVGAKLAWVNGEPELGGGGEAAPKGEAGAGFEVAAANGDPAGEGVAAANGEAWVGAMLA